MGIKSLHRERISEKWMDYMLGNDWSGLSMSNGRSVKAIRFL